MKDCAEAGRQCVRKIQQWPILSVEWIGLLDELKKLSRLVQLEGRMLPNTKVSEAQGRNKDSDGTLWDQEQHETAIRVLVEEAKVNLCLRIMNEFKKWSYDGAQKAATISQAMQEYQSPEAQIESKLAQFEECMGLLLWRAFVHVETLQLMDIPLLIEHIAMVLDHAYQVAQRTGGREPPAGAKMQETIALYYFASLMKHAEALNNAELLAKAREYRLLYLATDRLLRHHDQYPTDLIASVAQGMAALCDNEDFGSTWQGFFQGEDGGFSIAMKDRFLELEDKVVNKLLQENADNKKILRPLTDFFKKLQR
jgi:hypothetical protein